ncbi:MAG: hypothetical protein ACK5IP_20845 [Paracoccus sp. (in: a-proteobacteria)]
MNLIQTAGRGRVRAVAALIAALTLSACATAPAPNSPVTSAVPRPMPYRVLPAPTPAPERPAAAVTPAAPAAPAYSGAIDPRTGLRQSAVVAVSGDAASGYTLLYRPRNTEPASVDGAAGRLCGDAGVASSRSNSSGSGSAMPGVQIMIVKCNAA